MTQTTLDPPASARRRGLTPQTSLQGDIVNGKITLFHGNTIPLKKLFKGVFN
jgi:hypothetical protein